MVELLFDFLLNNLFIVSFVTTLFIVFSIQYKKVRKILFTLITIGLGVILFLVINKFVISFNILYLYVRNITYILTIIFSILQSVIFLHRNFYVFILNTLFEYNGLFFILNIFNNSFDTIIIFFTSIIVLLNLNLIYKDYKIVKNDIDIKLIDNKLFSLRL